MPRHFRIAVRLERFALATGSRNNGSRHVAYVRDMSSSCVHRGLLHDEVATSPHRIDENYGATSAPAGDKRSTIETCSDERQIKRLSAMMFASAGCRARRAEAGHRVFEVRRFSGNAKAKVRAPMRR